MVEHDLAKVGVAGSNPVSRSTLVPIYRGYFFLIRPGGGTGRHAGLKILWPLRPYRFDSDPGYGTGVFEIKIEAPVFAF